MQTQVNSVFWGDSAVDDNTVDVLNVFQYLWFEKKITVLQLMVTKPHMTSLTHKTVFLLFFLIYFR